MKLGERLRNTLAVARLTPRHLGGATRVHFVTIYRTMREDDSNTIQSIEHTLNEALNKIDQLVTDGMLPFTEKLTRSEKTKRLKDMLDNFNR